MTDETNTATQGGRRRQRILIVAGVAVVALALSAGGVAVAFSAAHADAAEKASTAVAAAQKQAARAESSAAELAESQVKATTLGEDLAPVLEPLTGVLAVERVDALVSAAAALQEALDASQARKAVVIPDIPEVTDDLSTDELLEVATEADRVAGMWASEAAETEDVRADVEQAAGDVAAAITAAAADAPTVAETLLAAAPSAVEEARAALVTAAESAATEPSAAALGLFATATGELRASHAAEEARKAAAAAKQATNTGKGSGGGRGNSSGGGSSGGGSDGGGGTSPPVDTNRYADPRGPYTPGCALGGLLYSADPGPGGTSVIASVSIPYDYRIAGNLVKVYACQ